MGWEGHLSWLLYKNNLFGIIYRIKIYLSKYLLYNLSVLR